jgi:hypothetical protein
VSLIEIRYGGGICNPEFGVKVELESPVVTVRRANGSDRRKIYKVKEPALHHCGLPAQQLFLRKD